MIYSKDKEMPLPTQEEVLICNEKTTAEEVLYHFHFMILEFHR